MLIDTGRVLSHLRARNIHIHGALHVGAHDCEESAFYSAMGVPAQDVVWIEAMEGKVAQAKARGVPHIYQAVVTDQDDQPVTFHISNNGQSSSVLEFGTHANEHPHVHYVRDVPLQSVTIDTFFARNPQLDPAKCEFWNFDIQGAELMALKGATQSIRYAKAIYLEVNERELYKQCGLIPEIDAFLAGHGFKRVETNMTRHGWGDALYIR